MSDSPPAPVVRVCLTGEGLTLPDVVRVARAFAPVTLDAAARQRVVAARTIVEDLARGDTLIYGVTSALGANTGQRIDVDERVGYQLRAIRARAVGVGAPLPTEI